MIVIERIVGTATKENWTQVYTFIPEGKKRNRGNLVLVLKLSCEKKEDEELDLAAFGKEAIIRFHESYYGSPKENIIGDLKKAFSVLNKEFGGKLEIEGIAGIILESKKGKVLYLGKIGKAQIKIWRDNKLFSLLPHFSPTVQTASGFLKEDDLVILGTDSFFKVVPDGMLQAAFQQSLSETKEMMALLVHSRKDSSQIAVGWFRLNQLPATSYQLPAREKEKIGKHDFLERFKEKAKGFLFKKKEKDLDVSVKRQRSFPLIGSGQVKPVKKTAFSVAFVFLLLLALSVFLGSKKKTETEKYETEASVLEKTAYNLEEARGLVELNPLRAKSLLKEAETALSEYRGEHEEVSEEFKSYEIKTIELLAEVSKEYNIESPDIFYDFSLLKEGFSGERLALAGYDLAVLSKNRDSVLNFNLEDKSAQIVAGGSDVEEAIDIGVVTPWIFLAKKDRLLVIDKIERKKIDEKELEDMKTVSLIGFGGNAYILDKKGGQIWRLAGLEDGLAAPKAYLKADKLDFSDAVSMAIDGSVWVLFFDGTVVKYTRGEKDAFSISGLDKPLNEPIKLFTDENQDNLYVLNPKDTRVVVIGKAAGEYRGSYIWTGIAGVSDFVVSEKLGKILLLTGNRVYGINIKN